MSEKIVKLKNGNLDDMPADVLYHLGIKVIKKSQDIEEHFGDVRFVCMGGTKWRMAALAKYLRTLLQIDENEELIDLCEHAHRYALYKVGPVLCVSHGVGMSTMSVVLHEILKLVKYAKCKDPVFIRIGTSGGLGVEPGTVVVSDRAYNGYLQNEHEIAILGERIRREARFDEQVRNDLMKCSKIEDTFQTIIGNTMAAECFYEGQGRLDGASCNYTKEQKMDFLKRCFDKCGIKNIEMEATMFSSLCLHVEVKAADVCVTLLDRLKGDQVHLTTEQKHDFEQRPLIIVGRYIKKKLEGK